MPDRHGGKIIGVDFDGTCVEHMYPDLGPSALYAEAVLKWLVEEKGCRLILYTMRSNAHLKEAYQWFEEQGIPLFGVNCNPYQLTWTQSPKVYCHHYIDDAAVGCPLMPGRMSDRPVVDWQEIRKRLEHLWSLENV